MQKRTIRWLAALAMALVFGFSLAIGDIQPPVAHGEPIPTPTPTETSDGVPGGSGGGGP